MVGVEVKILKIYFSRLAENAFLESFLYIFVRHLCHLFCYQVSYFSACLHSVQFSTSSQGIENFVSEFPG